MKRYYVYFLVILACLTACQEENPFVSKEVIDQIIEAKTPRPRGFITYIANNDIYLLKKFEGEPQRITFTPAVEKKAVKLSHDHSKLAYLTSEGSPIVIDTTGAVLARVTDYQAVKQMDWSYDDETLYMLVRDSLYFFGPAMDIPEVSKDYPTESVISAVITRGHELLYILHNRYGQWGNAQRLILKKPGEEKTTILQMEVHKEEMAQVNLSRDGAYFTVNYAAKNRERLIHKIDIYPIHAGEPELSWQNQQRFITPIYDDASKYIVAATRLNDSEDSCKLSATYTQNWAYEESQSKSRPDLVGALNSIYVDWK